MDAKEKQGSSDNGGAEAADRFYPLDRFNAFSDGVFAIVITLLVLDLPVPPSTEPLLPLVAESWPDFLGYLISFAFVGGIWLSHAGLTKYVRRGDAVSFRLNLVLLLFVSLLPFSTRVMVTHVKTADASVAVVLYGVNLCVALGLITALLYYAEHDRHLVMSDIADDRVRQAYRHRRAQLAITALVIAVALVAPVVALILCTILTLAFLIQPLTQIHRGH